MKRIAMICLLTTALLGPATTAQSPAVESAQNGIGRIGPVPAATLLMPYFEVDLDVPGTTEITFTNANAAPALVWITFWTNLGRSTLGFTMFLSGFDTLQLDIDNLFRTGSLPTFGPDDSNQGSYSDPNEAPDSCVFPLPSQIPASLLDYIRAGHTGEPFPNGFGDAGLCAGRQTGRIAQGYVTLDLVHDCALTFPSTPNFFQDGGQGKASNSNSLWGTYRTKVKGTSIGSSEPLVSIEARDSVSNGFWEPGDFTFYGNLTAGTAVDNREPLASSWGVAYEDGSTEAEESLLVYWRDSGVVQQSFTCGALPETYPLDANRFIAFDDEENIIEIPTGLQGFQWASGVTEPGDFGPLFERGWLFLDLSAIPAGPLAPVGQAFVSGVARTATGNTSYGAIAFDSALSPKPIDAEDRSLFSDDFESGDTSTWTLTFPLGGALP